MTETVKPKVVLDTNLFADYWFANNDNVDYIFDEVLYKRKITLLFSQETIGELMYASKRLLSTYNVPSGQSLSNLKEIAYFFYYGGSVNTKYIKVNYCKDSDDDIFLACGVAGHADYIISSDANSGIHSFRFNGLKIMTPAEFSDHWKTEYETG